MVGARGSDLCSAQHSTKQKLPCFSQTCAAHRGRRCSLGRRRDAPRGSRGGVACAQVNDGAPVRTAHAPRPRYQGARCATLGRQASAAFAHLPAVEAPGDSSQRRPVNIRTASEPLIEAPGKNRTYDGQCEWKTGATLLAALCRCPPIECEVNESWG